MLQGVNFGNAAGWRFAFNRDGSRLAYGAMTGPGTWVMVVDGVNSPAYRAVDFTQTALNGKRLVYVAQTADQKWHAVVDGKPGPAYDGISGLKLTPDGAHYAYIGQRSGAGAKPAFAVVDGVESPAHYGIGDLQAPDGRVAYEAVTTPGPPGGHGGGVAELIVGVLRAPNTLKFNASTYDKDRIGHRLGYASHRIAWSPDGKRFAYVQRNTPNPGVTVMVNGKAMGPTYLAAEELLWSPDGAHLTYQGGSPTGTFAVVGAKTDGTSKPAVWVDGVPHEGPLANYFHPAWSPDSKHFAAVVSTGTGWVIMVDGKVSPSYEDMLELNAGSHRFVDGHTYRFYGIKTGQIYRVTLDLGA